MGAHTLIGDRVANILIVEDELVLERIFSLNLVARGHGVAEAAGIAEAWRYLTSAGLRFDLLLLDINLPDGSGWDLLHRLRQYMQAASPRQDSTVMTMPPVIVVTAIRPSPQRVETWHPAAVLLKPFPIEALIRAIDRVLGASAPVDDAPMLLPQESW